jgi:hypothetical protein
MGARPKRILISNSLAKLRVPQAEVEKILQNLKTFESNLAEQELQTVIDAIVKDDAFRANFLKDAKSAVQNILK